MSDQPKRSLDDAIAKLLAPWLDVQASQPSSEARGSSSRLESEELETLASEVGRATA